MKFPALLCQKGIVHPLMLLAVLGIIGLILVTNPADIRTNLIALLPSSQSQTLGVSTTQTFQISSSSDDVNEENGSYDVYGDKHHTLWLGNGSSQDSAYTGLRFTNISVPKGATITSAKLEVFSAGDAWIGMKFKIHAENAGNSQTFSGDNLPSKRNKSSASVSHESNNKWFGGTWYQLDEMNNVVQEVVNRSDWHSGNSLSIILKGEGSVYGRKFVTSFDGGSSNAPKLHITFVSSESSSASVNQTPQPTKTPTPKPTEKEADENVEELTEEEETEHEENEDKEDTGEIPPPSPSTVPSSSPTPLPSIIPNGTTSLEYGTWTPKAPLDTCTKAQHDTYFAIGPDGKKYSTWHTVRGPGGCTFGHEHGDDPTNAPGLQGRSILFGYATEQVGMFEPHTGFKVFRWDNVSHVNAPDHKGANVVMMIHQGTSGAGRFTQPNHGAQFDYVNARDGREVHIHIIAPFGDLLVGCGANDPGMLLSQKQANIPGARQVSASKCFNLPNIAYEDWITAMYVGSYGGNWIAYIDPHFAIFLPNTYCEVNNNVCKLAYSDTKAGSGADPLSPAAQFKGTIREAYLNQVWIDNKTGSTSVWTDAYGNSVAPNTPGGIEQYISMQDIRPLNNSAAFGDDHIHDDGTVHAPN